MTVQPHSVRFHAPGEIDDRPFAVVSTYSEDTIPNPPCDNMDDALNIVLKHVEEFIHNDTENVDVRLGCLTADLGFKFNAHAFKILVDIHRTPMTHEYADYFYGQMVEFLNAHGVK